MRISDPLPFSLILSLSKGEAAAQSVDASSFDRLRMRRLLRSQTQIQIA